MPQHVFFDLDNTLTPSRRAIAPAHAPLFAALCAARDVVIVTGGTVEHIQTQLGPAQDAYFMLAQSGNHAVDKRSGELWRERLTAEQVSAALHLIDLLKRHFAITVKDEDDLVDNRGAQIGYSVIGYHEDAAKKDAFDPDFSRRKAALESLPSDIERLKRTGLEIFPAGSSGYNFTLMGKDKGANVARLIEREGWQKEACLYVGDALAPGENDFSVVGVIDTHAVSGPDDTFIFINQMLN